MVKIKFNPRITSLLALPSLVALDVYYFSFGFLMFLLGNALIVCSVIYIRLQSHGAASLIDPVIGMTQKLSFSERPIMLIGLISSGSFLISLIFKFVYLVAVS